MFVIRQSMLVVFVSVVLLCPFGEIVAQPTIASTPEGYNCEALNEDYQVRWRVNGDNLDIELVGDIPDEAYMAFGVSGLPDRTWMLGADIVVTDMASIDGTARARDFFMDGRSPCSGVSGVCSDSGSGFTDDVTGVSGEKDLGLTVVRYSRPLVPSDISARSPGGQSTSVDQSISVAAGVETFIAWALGPIDPSSGNPFFHTFGYPSNDSGFPVSIEFGRYVVDNCEPLADAVGSVAETASPAIVTIDSVSPTASPLAVAMDSTAPTASPLAGMTDSVPPTTSPLAVAMDSTAPTASPLAGMTDSVAPTASPRSPLITASPTNAPGDEDSITPGPVEASLDNNPQIVSTPEGYNCEALNADYQVRWRVNGENLDIELVGDIPDEAYMAFGVSGLPDRTWMLGADIVVTDMASIDGTARARDFFMDGRSPCSGVSGVCSDSGSGFIDDVTGVSGEKDLGLTLVRYTRPLVPSDISARSPGDQSTSVDQNISVAAGVETFIAWALGPIDPSSGNPLFHTFGYAGISGGFPVSLEFGRSVVDNCEPLAFDDVAVATDSPIAAPTTDKYFSTVGPTQEAATTDSPVISPTEEEDFDGFLTVDLEGQIEDGVLLYKFNKADVRAEGQDTISIVFEAPVLAWAGWAVSEEGFMVGSEAVIGLPETGEVLKYILGDQSVSGVQPKSAGQQTLIDASIRQVDGSTVLSFTKILVEPGEIPIKMDGDNAFLSSWGFSDTLSVHAARGSYLLSGEALEVREQSLWKAHGWLAALAWGVLSPLAIASSVLRRFFPQEDMWFHVHRCLNTLVVAFTLAAFVIAVVAINQETPSGVDPNHFDKSLAGGHRTIGLVIFVLALLQAMGGIFRPHITHKPVPTTDDHIGSLEAAPEKSSTRVFWEYGHKGMGISILALCWYQVQLGIKTYSDLFNAGDTGGLLAAFWAVAWTIGGMIVGGYILTAVVYPRRN